MRPTVGSGGPFVAAGWLLAASVVVSCSVQKLHTRSTIVIRLSQRGIAWRQGPIGISHLIQIDFTVIRLNFDYKFQIKALYCKIKIIITRLAAKLKLASNLKSSNT